MAELTGRIMNGHYLSFTPDGKPIVILELNEKYTAMQMVDELKSKDKLTVKIDEFKKKRSLNANNYAWKLITEIGNVTRQSKEDVYLTMLKRYGQSEMISVLADIPVGRFLKYYEEAGESSLNGKLFKHYRVYTGSSEFDTLEMSIFIDGVVSEAKELNIQTETPEQIAKMKSLWGE
jgi:hypothetical protein